MQRLNNIILSCRNQCALKDGILEIYWRGKIKEKKYQNENFLFPKQLRYLQDF